MEPGEPQHSPLAGSELQLRRGMVPSRYKKAASRSTVVGPSSSYKSLANHCDRQIWPIDWGRPLIVVSLVVVLTHPAMLSTQSYESMPLNGRLRIIRHQWHVFCFVLFVCLFVCFLLALAIIQHRVIARNKSLRISFLIHGINYWVIWLEDLLLGCNLKRRSPVRLFIAWVFFLCLFYGFSFLLFLPVRWRSTAAKTKTKRNNKKKKKKN